MSESTRLIGAHDHIVATLSHCASPDTRPTLGCLMMSAGVVHRVGPHRINVKLAHALAAANIPSIRVDLAAVGDSRAPPVDTPYDRQAIIDLRAATDFLVASTGVKRVAVFGICSGAVYGLRCALADERIVGVAMIDGYAYATRRTRRERWLQRMRNLDRKVLTRALRSRAERFGQSKKPRHERSPDAAPDYQLNNPPREEIAADLTTLLERGVSLWQIFTGSILQHYNYDKQFSDAFAEWPALQAIRTEFRPDFNHTLTTLTVQAEIIMQLQDWMMTMERDAALR